MDLRRRGNRVFPVEPWAVTETFPSFEDNLVRETIFTLANGFLGVRGAFEEGIANTETNPGTHLAGVYFRKPDASVFAKGPSPFPRTWHGMATFAEMLRVRPRVALEALDMRASRITDYRRRLDMKEAFVDRSLLWTPRAGTRLRVRSRRFVPMAPRCIALLRFEIEAVERAEFTLDAGIEKREGSRELGAACWAPGTALYPGRGQAVFRAALPASGFEAAAAVCARYTVDGRSEETSELFHACDDAALLERKFKLDAGRCLRLDLVAAVVSTRDTAPADLDFAALDRARRAAATGFDALLDGHRAWWKTFWARNDIEIDGDDEVQQGMRFCAFQIAQSRQAGDERISIGTNGLTGAMHGGLYFWDTEVYVLPAILHAEPGIARELLSYRFHTLAQAREHAAALGHPGAAYPWLTMSGDPNPAYYECAVGEQHINAAIPHAIDLYLDATEDIEFLWRQGAEIAIEQARFWADRARWSDRKQGYVLNQITGPDEYTAFNNNNCYSNVMARWALRFAARCLDRLRALDPDRAETLAARLGLDPGEPDRWREIAGRFHVPYDAALGIHPQDDAFLDLDRVDLRDIPLEDIPLEAHWPWDRVMRSRLLKQADVVLLEHLRFEEFSLDQKRADYAFYEPLTTHDSSLSASIHALAAAEIGAMDDARYYLYRSSRLDLDNINFNTGAGIHLANCGGAWMAVIHGVAGIRFRDGIARFAPALPPGWDRVAFSLAYRGRRLRVEIARTGAKLSLESGAPLAMAAAGLPDTLARDRPIILVPDAAS